MTVSEANAYASSVATLARKQRDYQFSRTDRTNRDGTRTRAARQTSRDLRAARTIRNLKGSR